MKTIILLSAKRCGSTAMFRIFQKHPDVGVCHHNQAIDYWEPNFWNLAHEAINGNTEAFKKRFRKSHPFLNIPDRVDKQVVFQLWDQILETQGPVVFDKSPQYLGDKHCLNLIQQYAERGNDVRILAMIRDPKDSITSQYEHWSQIVRNDSPKRRESNWLLKYGNLEQLMNSSRLPIYFYKYEDLTNNPQLTFHNIAEHCDITYLERCIEHIREINVGRYYESNISDIVKWEFSSEFIDHLKKYGYRTESIKQVSKMRYLIKLIEGIIKNMFGKNNTIQY